MNNLLNKAKTFQLWIIYILLSSCVGSVKKEAEKIYVNSFGIPMIKISYSLKAFKSTTADFYISASEITNLQYEKFDSTHKSKRDKYSLNDNQPVVWVSWYEAKKFTEWLSEKEGRIYSLPTEQQWLFAARGYTQIKYSTQDGYLNHDLANYFGQEGRDTFTFTSPVASFPSNLFGIYDMTGNVWEWCDSWYETQPTLHRVYIKVFSPHEFEFPFIWYCVPEKWKVFKGGSFMQDEPIQKITVRNGHSPTTISPSIGFRIVMKIE
jgi:formylglycine-generating enzyme required for sulfatase activity